jgi:hypothetical protein
MSYNLYFALAFLCAVAVQAQFDQTEMDKYPQLKKATDKALKIL